MNGSILLNGMLAGAAAYGLYASPPTSKGFAFTAMAFTVFHGLLGVVNAFKEDEKPCSKVHVISKAVMEIMPLPLVVIELYRTSALSAWAYAHFIFVIPMKFDLITKLYSDESTEGATEILKDITILGNILSLIYLAVNDAKLLLYGVAVSAFFSRYVSMLFENHIPCIGEFCVLFFNAAFTIMSALSIGGGAIPKLIPPTYQQQKTRSRMFSWKK